MLAVAPSRPLRVLLVDDVEDLRRLTRFALEMSGSFEVVAEAGDGAGGVALARAKGIISDLLGDPAAGGVPLRRDVAATLEPPA